MSDAPELSEYELQRLEQIRQNHEVLVSLGLAKSDDVDSVLLPLDKKKERKAATAKKPATSETSGAHVPHRWGTRSKNNVDHTEVTYEFSLAEERLMDQEERARRKEQRMTSAEQVTRSQRVSKPPVYHHDQMVSDILKRQDELLKNALRKMKPHSRPTDDRIDMSMFGDVIGKDIFTGTPLAPVASQPMPPPPVYAPGGNGNWPTQGEKVKCDMCGGIFVKKRSGAIRKHACRSRFSPYDTPVSGADNGDALLPSME